MYDASCNVSGPESVVLTMVTDEWETLKKKKEKKELAKTITPPLLLPEEVEVQQHNYSLNLESYHSKWKCE